MSSATPCPRLTGQCCTCSLDPVITPLAHLGQVERWQKLIEHRGPDFIEHYPGFGPDPNGKAQVLRPARLRSALPT
ncbi:hypothetical protein VV02_17180 [Luteipulveratus mongoliensis]|uniref:Uncharacterized protein n=1 Tax=Luteipulveratus mongoliensis TaxID=571913 RepID=A0A0K1JKD4_9MICO|nr:hypothetical protein VV02_17180 [Luteipulveratus mongoliensis]